MTIGGYSLGPEFVGSLFTSSFDRYTGGKVRVACLPIGGSGTLGTNDEFIVGRAQINKGARLVLGR